MADLRVESAVKGGLEENDVSADLYDSLDDEVSDLIEEADSERSQMIDTPFYRVLSTSCLQYSHDDFRLQRKVRG